MGEHSVAYVALDTSKLRNAVAIAEGGRDGEVRYLGAFDNTPAAIGKLVRKLSGRYERLSFCFEAGPTGYGLHRQITELGHDCIVVAPSLIPHKPGERVKTNRLDALALARQLRSGDLTAVWVPDAHHEAVRDLTRARGAAVQDLRRKRQQVSALLLRLGRHYPGKTSWGKAHHSWLASQTLEHLEQRIALEEMLHGVRQPVELRHVTAPWRSCSSSVWPPRRIARARPSARGRPCAGARTSTCRRSGSGRGTARPRRQGAPRSGTGSYRARSRRGSRLPTND